MPNWSNMPTELARMDDAIQRTISTFRPLPISDDKGSPCCMMAIDAVWRISEIESDEPLDIVPVEAATMGLCEMLADRGCQVVNLPHADGLFYMTDGMFEGGEWHLRVSAQYLP